MKKFYLSILFAFLLQFTHWGYAQNYQLVWEDNFNGNTLDSSKWNIEQKVGVWNTGGNKEFQHYKKENVSVGSDGEGNNCLIIEAKKENYNGYKYTSGRINTKGKMAFRRGKLEAMIKIPNLANGLWPAFWTLGYTPKGWPDCGEIDVLEMGHAAGIAAGKQNSFIGSHLFWGPYPRDYGKEYTASQNLSTGYFKHTVVWTETKISTYFNNSSTPYFEMGIDGADTEEFREYQHYIILNLAVGGSVPGIFNESQITAPLPARMYVDWVKLYQETNKTDLKQNDLPLFGLFGIYEDDASTDMRMNLGYDLFANTTGLTKNTLETPKRGSNVISYNSKEGENFELKLTAATPRNFSNYLKGSVQFYFKSNLTSDIQLGIADKNGKELFITVPAQVLSTSNTWQLAYLPLAAIAQVVDITALKEMLIVKANSPSAGYFSIDEVVFSETLPAEGYFGIYTNNSNISNKFPLNDVTGHLYNWSNTVAFNTTYPAFDGEEVLSFRSSGASNWWGFGIFSDQALNFESYANGFLNLQLRTLAKETFKIGINGANNTSGDVEFINGKDPYGFIRDGKWHKIAIPIIDFTKKGLDLSACGNIFTMSGSAIGDVAVDDIYLSESISTIQNPDSCYAVSLVVSPKTTTVKADTKRKFTAKATDQFGNNTDAFVTWQSSGGTIAADGNFVSSQAGSYTITALLGELSDTATITVDKKTGVVNLDNSIQIYYSSKNRSLTVSGLIDPSNIDIYNLTGAKVFSTKCIFPQMEISLDNLPTSTYFIKIQGNNKPQIKKFTNQ